MDNFIKKEIFLLSAAILLSNCSYLDDQRFGREATAKSYTDAASIMVAVTSASPWSVYARDLQPKFVLTADQAYAKALPASAMLDTQLAARDAVGLSLTGPTQQAPAGLTAGAITDPPAAKSALPATSGDSLLGSSATLEIDQSLAYSAATALYQEVQILNKYISTAAARDGYDAYFIRMNIELMPIKRNLPLDAYTDVSFFLKGDRSKLPIIIPMIASENYERAKSAYLQRYIFELSAALSGQLGYAGAKATVDSVRDELNRSLTSDINGILTVGRAGDNVMRVRMGARYADGGGYEMIPQVHRIAFMLLVPSDYDVANRNRERPIELQARHLYRNAHSGEVIAFGDDSDKQWNSTIANIISSYKLDTTFHAGCMINGGERRTVRDAVSGLRSLVVKGLYKEYNEQFHECFYYNGENGTREPYDLDDSNEVWALTTALLANFGGSYVTFGVPAPNRRKA